MSLRQVYKVNIIPVLGFSIQVQEQFYLWWMRWKSLTGRDLLPLPPLKTFSPKLDLPTLENYSVPAPDWYWKAFPSNLVPTGTKSVNGHILKSMAIEHGFKDLALLEKVFIDLTKGADIGCRGKFRKPGRSGNAPSATENGARVSDAIGDWVRKGYAFGPVPLHEVPGEAKFNGLMTRNKPNGSVRIILNLSSPKGSSVNDGINNEDFPTTMSSTSKWVAALWKAGKGCKMCKVDWSDAYKHISVRPIDTNLQWFTWLGKCFKELCLVFGGVSSAGLYDRLAKIVLFIVIKSSRFDPDLVIQHLDDCCAAGPANSSDLDVFDEEFSRVANLLGIKLAPRDDPDKSFGPSTRGTVLGVYYDTVAWTWAIPQEKLIRLMHDIRFILSVNEVEQVRIWSVVGKIQHVKPLVPGGHYNMHFLIKADSFSTERHVLVPVNPDLKRQLWFWQTMLPVCSGRTSIPRLGAFLPAWTLEVFTDAAGGSWLSPGQGVGAVGPTWWTYLPWSRAINSGRPTSEGKRLDRVMSALELVGPLLGLCAANQACRNTVVRFWVDNMGSVMIYKKGYSPSCPLSSALVHSIATVAAGIGCRVELEKITRCSSPGAVMADALSKGAFGRFWETVNTSRQIMDLKQLECPEALKDWVKNPSPDFGLGHKLLRELAQGGAVLGV